MNKKKKKLLTGDRPTGGLHLGHLVGSLHNRIAMQDEYHSFIMVADVQALTDNFDNPKKVRENVFEVVADNISVGVDPSKVTYFIQSQVPEIAELTVFYSNLVTVSELKRNPTVKNEISEKGHIFKDGNVTLGFLAYPVSQAADITFCRADVVPVGVDQEPMIELARELVRKFNNTYGDVFPVPKGIYSEVSKLNGLDGKKMSKSLGNAIYLTDSAEVVTKKIMSAKTDAGSEVIYDPVQKPEISNLITYYKVSSGLSIEEIEDRYKDITSYKTFKEDLCASLNTFLDPIRKRRAEIDKNPEIVWNMLEEGKIAARSEAAETLKIVREVMKIDY